MIKTVVAAACLSIAALAASVPAPPGNDTEHNARTQQEFARFNPQYAELKAGRVARLKALAAKVQDREAARQSTACSHQILWELKLLIATTADSGAIDRRTRDLESMLAHPERESAADVQDPRDGSWGACFEAWHMKLMASYDHLVEDQTAGYPPRFLDRINSPEKLTDYLTPIATSDIARTGVDHTFELNESLSDLMRLILRDRPRRYAWDPRLKATLMDLVLNRLRNPETGWWGERYVRDGKVKFVDDLSMTFHTVSYLHAEVSGLPKIVDTALALRQVDTPPGWLYKGAYWNHNNMDVAVLFQYGWKAASAEQRQRMKAELEKMLKWCLAESLQADGSFQPLIADGSLEEATYFGAAFLARIGYFDRARRFWTDVEFPESEAVRKKVLDNINSHLQTGGAGGSYYRSIIEELEPPAATAGRR